MRSLLALLAVLLVTAPLARAHGDPVSDRLLLSDVYFPETAVPDDLARRLITEVSKANGAGDPIKVALVASPSDLGPFSSLFGRPDALAQYLARDLIGVFQGLSLVIMPGQIGLASGSGFQVSSERAVLRGLEVGTGPAALAEAGSAAVRRLSAAPRPAGESGGALGADRIAIAVGGSILLLALVAGGVLAGRRQSRGAPPRP
ncbi:MAG: hypothetical protein H0V84_05015 [Actinobacteria bacterium]|nr:hypothetical protein [Actinomycetota bacterium]